MHDAHVGSLRLTGLKPTVWRMMDWAAVAVILRELSYLRTIEVVCDVVRPTERCFRISDELSSRLPDAYVTVSFVQIGEYQSTRRFMMMKLNDFMKESDADVVDSAM